MKSCTGTSHQGGVFAYALQNKIPVIYLVHIEVTTELSNYIYHFASIVLHQ